VIWEWRRGKALQPRVRPAPVAGPCRIGPARQAASLERDYLCLRERFSQGGESTMVDATRQRVRSVSFRLPIQLRPLRSLVHT